MAEGASPDEAFAIREAHSITRWIGADAESAEPRITDLDVAEPDCLIVCTDGLWNYFEDPRASQRFSPPPAAPPRRGSPGYWWTPPSTPAARTTSPWPSFRSVRHGVRPLQRRSDRDNGGIRYRMLPERVPPDGRHAHERRHHRPAERDIGCYRGGRSGATRPRTAAEVIILDTVGIDEAGQDRQAKEATAAAIDCLPDGVRFAVVGRQPRGQDGLPCRTTVAARDDLFTRRSEAGLGTPRGQRGDGDRVLDQPDHRPAARPAGHPACDPADRWPQRERVARGAGPGSAPGRGRLPVRLPRGRGRNSWWPSSRRSPMRFSALRTSSRTRPACGRTSPP